MKKRILVIGSTGKLGKKLLNYCFKNKIYISGITCYKNINLLIKQGKSYKIKDKFILSEKLIKKILKNT